MNQLSDFLKELDNVLAMPENEKNNIIKKWHNDNEHKLWFEQITKLSSNEIENLRGNFLK